MLDLAYCVDYATCVMVSELRAFVQVATGLHGITWMSAELPTTLCVPEDEGPSNELDLPDDVLFSVILGRQSEHYGWFLDVDDASRKIPDDFREVDLYEPPYTRKGTWLTLQEILAHPWESIVPHTASPLFNRADQGLTALSCCAQSLAFLGRLVGFLNQCPSNIRLVFWLEGLEPAAL